MKNSDEKIPTNHIIQLGAYCVVFVYFFLVVVEEWKIEEALK